MVLSNGDCHEDRRWRASDPPEADLGRLWRASHRVRDARLTRAVLGTLRDPARSRAVRLTAVRVLATHAAPDLVVLASDLELLRGDSPTQATYISRDHVDAQEGSVPITPALVAEVKEVLGLIGREDADAEVRSAALVVARQIGMRTRTTPSH